MPDAGSATPAPLDAILQKVLDAVPFQLTTDRGVELARQRFRDLPRREVHPELRAEDHVVDGPALSIPTRVCWPPDDEAEPPIVVFISRRRLRRS